jgi:hypothetical protein
MQKTNYKDNRKETVVITKMYGVLESIYAFKHIIDSFNLNLRVLRDGTELILKCFSLSLATSNISSLHHTA